MPSNFESKCKCKHLLHFYKMIHQENWLPMTNISHYKFLILSSFPSHTARTRTCLFQSYLHIPFRGKYIIKKQGYFLYNENITCTKNIFSPLLCPHRHFWEECSVGRIYLLELSGFTPSSLLTVTRHRHMFA